MVTFLKTVQNTVKHWYLPAIIGLLLTLLGIYLLSVPESTYFTLATIFSISFVVSGIIDIYFSIQNRNELEGWGWYLTSGIFSLMIGLILIARPGLAMTALPFFVGFSLLFRSLQGLGFAFELKNYGILNWGNLAIISIIGMILSFLLIAHPVFTGLSLAILTALSFIFVGIAAIVLSFQLKKLKSFPSRINKDLKDRLEGLRNEYYSHLDKRR